MTPNNETTPGANQGSVHTNTPARTIPVNKHENAATSSYLQEQTAPKGYDDRPTPPFNRSFTAGDHYCLRHAHRVVSLRYMLGFDAVLVPIGWGTKTPTRMAIGYPDFNASVMENQNYLAELERNNIALLTGPRSNNLVTIDFDDVDASNEFLELNRDAFENMLRVHGSRCFNLLFRLEGEYPVGCSQIKNVQGVNVGEFRAGHCLTILDGLHPSGVKYKMEGNRFPVLKFNQIVWPQGWTSTCIPNAYDTLFTKYGQPFTTTNRGRIMLNEPWFVAKFAAEHLVLHDPERGFYEYDGGTGVWTPRTEASIAHQFSLDLKSAADEFNAPGILHLRKASFHGSLVSQLRGLVEHKGAFDTARRKLIHIANGMLDLSSGTPDLIAFHPDYRSLHQLPWTYDKTAQCPRFLKELLDPAMSPGDIALLQKLCGQVLLGSNLSQKVVVLEGPGGAGKGTFSEVLDLIVGERNVAELRTSHLTNRFELGAFLGKILLCGRDVNGTFLNGAGASVLKKLTGGDLLEVELKGQQGRQNMRGVFSVFITTNTRLLVALEGDKSAWERRLVVLRFLRSSFVKPIPHFARNLIEEEGLGIFAWMVEGAVKFLEDIHQFGQVFMDPDQKARVTELLTESDSIASFVAQRTVAYSQGYTTTATLFLAYGEYCANAGFDAIPERLFQKRVGTELLEIHGAHSSENVVQHGVRKRGYAGVRVLSSADADVGKVQM